MELILPAACAAAGGAALAAACWRSSRGACLWLGLTAAAVAVLAAVHDAGTAAALLLVHGAVGLAAMTSGEVPSPAAGLRRVLPGLVVVGLGTLLAAALAAGAAENPSPPYPPRSGPLVLALGGLVLLSGVIGIGALSRTRAPGGPDSERGT